MATARRESTNRITAPEVLVRDKWLPSPLEQTLKLNPNSHLGRAVKEILRFLPNSAEARAAAAELIGRLTQCVVIESRLWVKIFRPPGTIGNETNRLVVEDYGLVCERKVTTAAMNAVVDAFQGSFNLSDFNFHGLGTGSGAEGAGDTALGTELTTEYTGNLRATGTQGEGASANIYNTTATNTLDGTPGAAIREHGVFTSATPGMGTLLDRSLIGPYTLSSGQGIQTPYEITFTAGG